MFFLLFCFGWCSPRSGMPSVASCAPRGGVLWVRAANYPQRNFGLDLGRSRVLSWCVFQIGAFETNYCDKIELLRNLMYGAGLPRQTLTAPALCHGWSISRAWGMWADRPHRGFITYVRLYRKRACGREISCSLRGPIPAQTR